MSFYGQATLGVGSVNFRTVDFGGAFFHWSYCVLSDSLVLRCMMFMFRVKEADLGMTAFVPDDTRRAHASVSHSRVGTAIIGS